MRLRTLTLVLGKSSVREVPRVGSGRYSPGPGTVSLLEKRLLPGNTPDDGILFTDPARFPCYRLEGRLHFPVGRPRPAEIGQLLHTRMSHPVRGQVCPEGASQGQEGRRDP